MYKYIFQFFFISPDNTILVPGTGWIAAANILLAIESADTGAYFLKGPIMSGLNSFPKKTPTSSAGLFSFLIPLISDGLKITNEG